MSECYSEPSSLNLGVALFLVIGTVVSYIPQYIAIVRAGSSEGISFMMLAILLLSSFLTAINSGILKWTHVVCCQHLSLGQCLKNNLATEQLLAGAILTIVLYILFLVYFKTEPTGKHTREKRVRNKLIALGTFVAVITLSVLLSVLGGILYYTLKFTSKVLIGYAQALGTTSSIMMVLEWAPQIYTTWKMKSPGSLSVLMLLIQIPGSLLVIYFQAILNEADFTTWAPYFFQCVEQGILVAMCLIFWIRSKQNRGLEKRPLLEEVIAAEDKHSDSFNPINVKSKPTKFRELEAADAL